MNEEDISIEPNGEFSLFRPRNEQAKEWLAENSEERWYRGALAVPYDHALDFERQCSEDGGFIVA